MTYQTHTSDDVTLQGVLHKRIPFIKIEQILEYKVSDRDGLNKWITMLKSEVQYEVSKVSQSII